jgi:hypothetical protein
LSWAADLGLKHILVVQGDGGPLLSKLDSKEMGAEKSVVTSIDLILYIHRSYPGQFITAAAFNPYKPLRIEMECMKQKIAAGAGYAVTQPIIGMEPDKLYHAKGLHGKFKMVVSGCHLSCSESWVRDIGLIGLKDGWQVVIGGNVGADPRIAQEVASGLDNAGILKAVEKIVQCYQESA